MPLRLHWQEIALRILLSVIAGAVFGFDRSVRGHPAGLRTTILVCLAASVSMIQANLLLVTEGKGPGSFAVLDVMRLPLGILTGMGFIGAGAIVRRGGGVSGVTTAAVLWFVTVIGLCLGGGQIVLGCSVAALAFLALLGLKRLERHLPTTVRAILTIRLKTGESAPDEPSVQGWIEASGYDFRRGEVNYRRGAGETASRTVTLTYEVRGRKDHASGCDLPAFVAELSRRPGVDAVHWRPSSA